MKLAKSLSPISKKLVEVKKTTQELGEVIKKSQPTTPQLAIEKTPQAAIENTHNALPIENEQIQPGVIYDTSLENTLKNMKNNTCFFNIEESVNVLMVLFFGLGFQLKKWVVINSRSTK